MWYSLASVLRDRAPATRLELVITRPEVVVTGLEDDPGAFGFGHSQRSVQCPLGGRILPDHHYAVVFKLEGLYVVLHEMHPARFPSNGQNYQL